MNLSDRRSVTASILCCKRLPQHQHRRKLQHFILSASAPRLNATKDNKQEPVPMSSLEGQVAIVTGAAGNLGHAVCRTLLDQGARVAQVDLDTRALESARAELNSGSLSAAFAADLIDPNSVRDMVAAVVEHFGRIDILANIAGGFTMGPPLHETPDKDWNFMMNLNARTVFNSCRGVIPHMLAAGGGRIVNVSARAATQGKGNMAPYCASKAAVITLTESLAA